MSQEFFSLIQSLYNRQETQGPLSLLQYDFKDKSLWIKALTHSSYSNEYAGPPALESNETLEFLGDAILQAIISSEIYRRFSLTGVDEGTLSKLRGTIVNQETLTSLALYLGLDKGLLLGRGEAKKMQERFESSLLSDALEAVVAALYLDGGLELSYQCVMKLLTDYEKTQGINLFDLDHIVHFDAKSKLQELTMALFKQLPEYRVVQNGPMEGGPFEVVLMICGREVARTLNASKRKAEKWLAQKALKDRLYESQSSGPEANHAAKAR